MTDKSSVAELQAEIFRKQWNQHPGLPQGLFWRDAATQELRFEKLVERLKCNSKSMSLLDVGCGCADFKAYLNSRGLNCEYTGIDIVNEMLQWAQNSHPDGTFINSDFLSDYDACDKTFDWVVSSGVFNYRATISFDDWRDYVLASLRKMFALAQGAISFNFLVDSVTYRSEELAYFSVDEIVGFCRGSLSPYLSVDHDYPLYECTVTVFRPAYVQQKYSAAEFQRYWAERGALW